VIFIQNMSNGQTVKQLEKNKIINNIMIKKFNEYKINEEQENIDYKEIIGEVE